MGAIELEALRKRARAAGVDPGALVRAARRKARDRARREEARAQEARAEAERAASRDPAASSPPAAKKAADRLVEPVRLDFSGARWVVAYVRPSAAREIADDLTALGYRAYCPLGRRIVYRARVPKGVSPQVERRRRREECFPVFGGYVFVGETAGAEPLTRGAHDGIVEVLGDARGRLAMRPESLAAINAAECAGQWDSTTRISGKAATWVKPNARGQIAGGPFAGFFALVEQVERSGRIRIVADIFGRQTRVTVDQAALVEA